jgi:hypothetical protein
MSLFRICRLASPRCAGRRLTQSVLRARGLATDPSSSEVLKKESSEIVKHPQQDVVAADVASGAPSPSNRPSYCGETGSSDLENQRNCAIVSSASTSQRRTPCKVEVPRQNAGVSTGISCREVDDGRIP